MMRQLKVKLKPLFWVGHRILLAGVLLAALLVTSCGFGSWWPGGQAPDYGADGLVVHFLNVGQADCALVQCGSASMLIDAGNVSDGEFIVRYLKRQGVGELACVIATHAHEDHAGGMAEVLKAFPASAVYAPVTEDANNFWQDFLAAAQAQERSITVCARGMEWPLGEARVTVLSPFLPIDTEDGNNSSIVLKITYQSVSFLFTGDAELKAETRMLDAESDLSANVLKVGHHGSSTSTGYRFLREVMPQMAVISVGKDNAYGHPHEDTLSRLSDAEVTVYRTDTHGTVVIATDGTTLFVTKSTGTSAMALAPKRLDPWQASVD